MQPKGKQKANKGGGTGKQKVNKGGGTGKQKVNKGGDTGKQKVNMLRQAQQPCFGRLSESGDSCQKNHFCDKDFFRSGMILAA